MERRAFLGAASLASAAAALARMPVARASTERWRAFESTTRVELLKGWNFIAPDPASVPDAGAAFKYCATDGRPHTITGRRGKIDVAKVHPTPTRPMCYVAETQLELFQGIMGGAIDPPIDEQLALLREYYDCARIKGKVSARRFRAMCEIDVKEFR